MKFLEIIALSYKDVVSISQSEADRIELCIDIQKGGLSPSLDLVNQCLKVTNKPIRIMVRIKDSFVINESEKKLILQYIQSLKKINNKYLNGIVIGYLNSNNKIDQEFTQQIIEHKGHLEVCFHKAFDLIINDQNEVDKLFDYKINTVLTQGGKNKITDNIVVLKNLIKNNSQVEILLGGGIDQTNIKQLIKLNTSIHLGSYARESSSYDKEIDIKKINNIKNNIIKNN